MPTLRTTLPSLYLSRLAFLEGGYDLDALARSAGACVAALAGEVYLPEPVTAGGPGYRIVEAAAALHQG